MNEGMLVRWRLGLSPARWWTESEQLERDARLGACLTEAGVWLISTAARELVANAQRHGQATGEAELLLDVAAARITMVIPGPAFDSATEAKRRSPGFLARLDSMLEEDGAQWSWTSNGHLNRIDFSLGSARTWRSIGRTNHE